MNYFKKWLIQFAFCVTLSGFIVKASFGAISFEGVCTTEEKWNLGTQDKETVELYAAKAPENYQGIFFKLNDILTKKINPKAGLDAHTVAFLNHYWIWRMFMQMGLSHLAEQGFSQLAMQANYPQTAVIREAALSCAYQIHRRYPTLTFSNDLVKVLNTIGFGTVQNPSTRFHLVAMSGMMILQGLEQYPTADAASLQRLLAWSEPISNFVTGVEKARQDDTVEAVKRLKAFVDSKSIPDSWRKYKSMANLLLGEMYSDMDQIEQSIQALEKVDPKSVWFSEAQAARSWVYLRKLEYSKVLGATFHFQLPEYKNRFAPEPLIASAMAFTETCHYPEAWQSLVLFGRTYQPVMTWLKSNDLKSPYDYILASLDSKSKKTNMPPQRVMADWISSPTFIDSQSELNLVVDENSRLAVINQYLAKLQAPAEKGKYKGMSDTVKALSKTLPDTLKARESQLIAKINQNFKERAQEMIARVETLIESAQFVEVEVVNGGGEAFISGDRNLAKDNAEDQKVSDKPKAKGYAWGKRLANSKEAQEIWIDEIGLFQASIQSECQ